MDFIKNVKTWQWIALAAFILYLVFMGTVNSEVLKLVGADVEAGEDTDFNKDKNLKIGHRGVEVLRLQQLLKGAGQNIEANGIFDRHTRTALNAVAGIESGTYNDVLAAIASKTGDTKEEDVDE